MLKLSTKTKLTPEETVKRAVAFFGPRGLGLKVKEQDELCISFEGGGGGVGITTCAEGKGATVDIESREWDNQVKEFITKIR